jgi:hypothetical protein
MTANSGADNPDIIRDDSACSRSRPNTFNAEFENASNKLAEIPETVFVRLGSSSFEIRAAVLLRRRNECLMARNEL